jgi:hypothetical protein
MRNKILATMFALAIAVALAGCGGGSSNNGGGGGGGGGGTGPTLSSITITPFAPGVAIGNTTNLKATGAFSDNSTKDISSTVSWTSSDQALATVTGGAVMGVAVGVPTITATQGSVSASTVVNVVAAKVADNSALNGNFAFFISLIDTRGQAYLIGRFTADGNGNITSGSADSNTATGTSSAGATALLASTYQVYDDGRGQATLNIGSTSFTVAFVLSQFNGATPNLPGRGDLITLDTHTAYGFFEPQTSGTVSGNYAFGLSGLDSTATQPEGMVGEFTVSGTNITTGERDIQVGASATATQQVFTGTLTAADANGRGTLTLGGGNFAYYVVNANRLYLVQTDTGTNSALGGTAETQAAGPFNATTSVAASYDFLLDHAATQSNGTFEKAGHLILNSGTLTPGTNEDDDLEDVRVQITSGTYSAVDTHGRTAIHATTQPPAPAPAGTSDQVAYIVQPAGGATPSRLYMMSTDAAHGQPGVGFADQAAGTAIFNPPGAYNFVMSELGEASKGGNITELGQFTVTGTTNLKGIVVTNNNSTSAQKLTATAATATLPAANGRIEIIPSKLSSPGFGTANGLIMYIRDTQGGIMLGESPDIDGRFFHQ